MAADTTSSGERFAQIGPIRLCYETFGDASAPPVLLVMGLGAQMTAWDDAFCRGLAAEGLFVVRFDNRDIGKSTHLTEAPTPNVLALMGMAAIGRPLNVPYTLRDMAGDAAGLLDHLGIASAHIVGASMGGAIAQEMAIHLPRRVRSMTCIMSSTGDPRLPPPTTEALAVLFKPAPTDRDSYLRHHQNVLRVLRGSHFTEDAANDEARARRNLERGLNPPGVVRQFAAITASGNRTKALGEVRVPTLVIHGDADPLIRVAGGHAIVKAVGHAEVDIIRGMGHTLPSAVQPRIIGRIASHVRRVEVEKTP